MFQKRRVVITGIGVVSSIGYGVSDFGKAIQSGKSGITEITSFDTTGYSINQGGQIHNFNPVPWIKNLDINELGLCSQFSIASAYMAIDDAKIDLDELLKTKVCGVSIGTTDGESRIIDHVTEKWVKEGPEYLQDIRYKSIPSNILSLSVAQELNLNGDALTTLSACAAGNYAIGYAYDLVSSGEADFMLCGGSDTINRKTFTGFYRLGTMASKICRPFDKNREGLLVGEGSGILFLETYENAEKRGAHIYAEILGYGLNCDASHMVTPNKESIANCMRIAHCNSGIKPEEVDYVSAHGTGTQLNDKTESSAIKEVFGRDTAPPISSLKSMIGHTMGASSALTTIACAIGINKSFIPPTINFQTMDPECDIDCVPNEARKKSLNIVQSNAFAFGGNNAIIILSKCHP